MKWLRRAAAAGLLVVIAVTCVGSYSIWRECKAAGGTTVRALFGLECIK